MARISVPTKSSVDQRNDARADRVSDDLGMRSRTEK